MRNQKMQTYIVNFGEWIDFTFTAPIFHSTANIFQQKWNDWGKIKNQYRGNLDCRCTFVDPFPAEEG